MESIYPHIPPNLFPRIINCKKIVVIISLAFNTVIKQPSNAAYLNTQPKLCYSTTSFKKLLY